MKSVIDSESGNGLAGLLQRVLPHHARRFEFEHLSGTNLGDTFEIEAVDSQIVIRGSADHVFPAGLGWYLRHIAGADCSWSRGWKDPDTLLLPPAPVRKQTTLHHRYYLNWVTFSYSLAFWNWERWQREIDWMALHGITMPLAITGEELVWLNVLTRLGLPKDEIDQYLVGPAFQPFGLLGVMDGWGGPLPQAWAVRHGELQRAILSRQRSLGMTPVLQGFIGHVPQALQGLYPQARFRQSSLSSFPPTCMIEPMDPLFYEIGTLFYEEQRHIYGTDHFYGLDTFMLTGDRDTPAQDLADVASAFYTTMERTDPEATWVIQSWPFQTTGSLWSPDQTRSFLDAVPDARLIVLDLWAEQRPMWTTSEAFHGKPWIWCLLHNFGSRQGLHGDLRTIQSDLRAALEADLSRGTLSGGGITAEAIEQNDVVYEFLADIFWEQDPIDVESWVTSFAWRRYGSTDTHGRAAWRLLLEAVYSHHDPYKTERHQIICERPSVGRLSSLEPVGLADSAMITSLTTALDHLLLVKPGPEQQSALRRDIIDVTHHITGLVALHVFVKMKSAFQAADVTDFRERSSVFIDLLVLMGQLSGTHEDFLLGRWLANARQWGQTPEEQDLLERNARLLVTLWSWPGSSLNDYSGRFWAGLLDDYYIKRWRWFVDTWSGRVADGESPADLDMTDLFAWEEQWASSTNRELTEPHGDTMGCARKVIEYLASLQGAGFSRE